MPADDLLQKALQADLLRFTTAGSVDDGKSTLIGRLLHDSKGLYEDQLSQVQAASAKNGQSGVDWALVTDGLKAEREQRITIDVAYRHFSTPRRRFIIADTPGHEQYTRNMATGASTADLAIILIDAEQGVLTQSKRHGAIASLLGIPHLVVAVNKMDLVGYDESVFNRLRDTYAAWATRLRGPEPVFIPISALLGDNVVEPSASMPWYMGPTLLHHLETVPLTPPVGADFRFPVQYVLRPDGEFRGYAGTIASGQVRLGDEVTVLPGGRRTRVSRIVGPRGELGVAIADQAVTLCLADDIDVGRGAMLAHPESPPREAEALEATLVWMNAEPLAIDRPYLLKQTTNLVRGRVSEVVHRLDPETLDHESASSLALNEIGRVQIRLQRPLLCDAYAHNRHTGGFILIDPDSNATIAAGMVVDRLPETPPPAPPPKGTNLTRHAGRVTPDDRAALLGQQPATLWLTGLSGAGKSTLAYALEERLVSAGHACAVLDGDNVRYGLNRDLGFSPRDRSENIRRVAEVARLFNEAGLIVLTAFISPYREDRDQARAVVGDERFVEVFVDAPLATCEARDPKGLYAKARAGEIPQFTGISAPYEAPETPELRLDTAGASVDELVERAWAWLSERGVLAAE